MDIHREGRQLVQDIIRRKRARMLVEGTPECETCPYPHPGTCLAICPQGCRHYLCPACAEETQEKKVHASENGKPTLPGRKVCGVPLPLEERRLPS